MRTAIRVMLILGIVGSAGVMAEMIVGFIMVNYLRPEGIEGSGDPTVLYAFLEKVVFLFSTSMLVAGALLTFSIVALVLSKDE